MGVVASIVLFLSGCSPRHGDQAADATPSIQSVYTELDGGACKTAVDKSDPNETPYLACPGVGGYSLIVRRVDSGRKSIDVVDPAQQVLPLHYQEFVTRHMSTLGDKAEWRVANKAGGQVPVSLIVRVHAREDDKDPEHVTRTYIAVAKITPNEACVTERIPEGTRPEAEVRSASDTAPDRQCAPAQPPMSADGIVIR
jgi:hypothetical protein